MTTIGLIRHGVTDWNKEMRIQGHSDIPLNEDGRRQALLLGKRIGGESWDAVYSSDLGRALETAHAAAAGGGLPVTVDPRLRELYFGEIEGSTEEERVSRWGADWRQLELGQEPREAAAARGAKAIAEIAGRHRGGRVLVVSHGGLIGSAIRKLIPDMPFPSLLGNTSVTLVRRLSDDRWACDLYNCTKHLSE